MEEFGISKNGILKKYHEIEGKTNVVVPDVVTEIGNSVFMFCENLTSITLPKNLRKIGCEAFFGCTNLININLPENITEIYESAFAYCPNLRNIRLPEGITLLSHCVFDHCTSLTSINLPEGINISCGPFNECTGLINVRTSEKIFSRFTYDTQILIISNFVRQYNTNNIYTEEEINRYKIFIKLIKNRTFKGYELYSRKSRKEIIKEYMTIIIQNKELLYFMCNNMDNAFTTKEVDELIKLSVEIGELETTTLLINYKNNHFGFQKPLDNDELNLTDYSKEELEKIEEKEKTKKKTDNKNRKS